ncbi:MAG: LPS export ABC transporter periplasmic protein LptC [Kangiellaceae bacterium]|nr:LPS export ABC transporter periplasmic protein LptC [Kangiellaceae bacterium]
MKRLKLNRWLISLITVAMLVLVFKPEQKTDNSPKNADMPSSDYFMKDVTVIQYDTNGKVTSTLVANKMEHHIEDDLSLLENPSITYQTSDLGNWKLKSPRGVLKSNHLLELQNKVTIEEFDKENYAKSRITTYDLKIDFTKNVARTEASVLIESIHQTTESVGLEFDMLNEIIRLTSDVKIEVYQQ